MSILVREKNASRGERYFDDYSPFQFSSAETPLTHDGAPSPFSQSFLSGISIERFVQFLDRERPALFEEKAICLGLRARVICPTKIIRTVHLESFETPSIEFVQCAMALDLCQLLSFCLNSGRLYQLGKEAPSWTGTELLQECRLDDFPFDLFFLLGGLDATLTGYSENQFKRQLENQRVPVLATVAVMHLLHRRLEESSRTARLPRWGINRAKLEAAKLLRAVGVKRGASPETIQNHWEAMQISAPLIYASVLTDNGTMLSWLLGEGDPYVMEFVARFIPEWFNRANAVAEQLLKPLGLLHKDWKPLKVDDSASLPAALSDEKIREILGWEMTATAVFERGTGRFGNLEILEDGSRIYHPDPRDSVRS